MPLLGRNPASWNLKGPLVTHDKAVVKDGLLNQSSGLLIFLEV